MKNTTMKWLQKLGLSALLMVATLTVHAAPLTVAVAANVRYAFDELAAEFRNETGIDVQGVLGSSGKITAQVRSGAPYDVFISADTGYPATLYKDGLAVDSPRVYGYGVLVLWTTKALDMSRGLSLLSDAGVQKIAIANPKLAPYGRAAMQALESAGLSASLEPKLVYGESITQTAQYVDSGAADIGFVAKSIVLAPGLAGKGKWMEIPGNSYAPIAQGVVVLRHGMQTQPVNARKFMDFLFTPKARAILEKYGYQLP